MKIQIINPIEYPNWDDLLRTHTDTTFFRTSAWAKVLSESYRYKPLYFTGIEDSKLSALIPIMEIKSILTGKRAVSLPFTDECPPLTQNPYHFQSLMNNLTSHGKQANWKYIEFRGENQFFRGSSTLTHHFTHTLTLAKDEKSIFSSLKSNVKRNIKKARKEALEPVLSNDWSAVCDFYRLNCMTRKDHGLPPQPLTFFRKIYDYIIEPRHGFISLALHQTKPVAGAVFFHHNGKAIYKYGASDRKYQSLRPNNLVMWQAVKWCCDNGLKRMSFGRTAMDNRGLLQFKHGWGTKEKIIK
jgi:lipid II:glycine glycyltransferase (peptidoglycan interpeptide bridge formation enzyme)